jgi:hypothetical protein
MTSSAFNVLSASATWRFDTANDGLGFWGMRSSGTLLGFEQQIGR